jgi:signal transduction histidine kinase/CheY-like chemotaxis protein
MAEQQLRILLVEDSPTDAQLLCEALAESGHIQIVHVDRLRHAVDCLKERVFDAVLLDLSLPDSSGLSTVDRIIPINPQSPLIVLTGIEDETLALEAIRKGAQDYLVKGNCSPPMLVRAIRYAIDRKRAERERELSIEFLRLVNASNETRQLIEASVRFFQKQSGCEAVGIRLRNGEDYPYYEAKGFAEEFILAESLLCVRDPDCATQCDSAGNPALACMCGNVIRGRFDATKSFFTLKGTFWTNSTSQLLATTTEVDRQARTRNRCNGEGYESVALIALRSGEQCLGLLQLNDRRRGMFSSEAIALWERLVGYMSISLAKELAEEKLKKENRNILLANRIMEAFVKDASVGVFDKALSIVLEAMKSERGIFGYIDERGCLICPSMSGLPGKCENAGEYYPPETWEGLWGRALLEKKTLFINKPSMAQAGDMPMRRNIAAPILMQETVVGLLYLENKETDYTEDDREALGAVAGRIAPILYAWIEKTMRDAERRRAEAELKLLNEALEQRVAQRTAEAERRSEQLRKLTSELTLTEQRERQRLAQVLHDGLQQILVGAKFRLAFIERDQDVQRSANQVRELIDAAIQTSRSLTAELSPPVLLRGDLFSALKWLADWMRDKYELDVRVVSRNKIQPLTQETMLLLFQATRELLFNVVKHAGVRAAQVKMDQLDGQILISVEDDGIGFDPSQIRSHGGPSGGFGLFSISERLSCIGGSLEIDGAQDRGSRFRLIVPQSALVAENSSAI